MTDENRGNIYRDVIHWLHQLHRVIVELVVIFDAWYRRRRLLTRATLGASAGAVLSLFTTEFDASVVQHVYPLGTNQLLIVLIGVSIGQTTIQTRTLNNIAAEFEYMRTRDARTDGGRHSAEDGDPHRVDVPRVSGGGAIGGAIVGGGLGSSYGPGGAVAGAVMGAVLGDWFEERALV